MVEVAVERRVIDAARAIASVTPPLAALEDEDTVWAVARAAATRGHFAPEEEAILRGWFARYLTMRAALMEIVDDLRVLTRPEADLHPDDRLRVFLVAYTAAAWLVRSGRKLVAELASDKHVQRKLNEADVRMRIPRKQYTRIYRGLTSPANAWSLADAIRWADAHRDGLQGLAQDPVLAPVVTALDRAEPSLRMSTRAYLEARLRYRLHSWRRRRASAAQQGLFAISEACGRVIAEARRPGHASRLDEGIRARLAAVLQPGDVIVTRHDDALSNLFLPGYWPHAALYVGGVADRERLGVDVDDERRTRWVDPLVVLEARKDGVRLREIVDTLAVDACAVIRPRLDGRLLAQALARALSHEGKAYNFDFDFFTSDRLVCTEVVYRAYEGLGGIAFPLVTRSGRPTLSAEDLLDQACHDRGFEAVAVFGAANIGNRLVTGPHALTALLGSYDARGSNACREGGDDVS